MMSVMEYAESTNHSVAEILKKCQELGIKVNNKEDMLSDDDIVILDNVTNLISTDEETSFEEEDDLDDAVENIIENNNIDKKYKPNLQNNTKLKRPVAPTQNKKEFLNKRKEMYKNKKKLEGNVETDNVILFHDGITVKELAEEIGCSAAQLITKLMANGLMVNMTMPVDFDSAAVVALDYGKTLKKDVTQDITNFEEYEIIDDPNNLETRPPVITIMGHVDHGKTTLLDTIRNSNIVDSESGGITQAIGAYQIEHNGTKMTFIDTPGHAAFTEMRARGAQVTDIVIIIVAADDGVMPQTKEAINHALAAKVPIIVAVNKMDKPDANPDRVMQEMAEFNITPEEWGGNYPFVKISAKSGLGLDDLFATIEVQAELLDLKANPKRYAIGSVIESKQDKKVGGVASLLIQNGTLRLGDPIVVGTFYGKVRTMKNDHGISIVSAGPSTPVSITGLTGNPLSGDKFMAFETESEAKNIAAKRAEQARKETLTKKAMTLDSLFEAIDSGVKEINVILKSDVRGSEEAVSNALEKIDVEGVKVKIIHSDIGNITEGDVVLATASNAIIIGFNVVPSTLTKELAKEHNVEIRLYTIIYKLVEDVEQAMKGLLDPEFKEEVIGHAEVRQIFTYSKVGKIAGLYITDGLIKAGANIRVLRDSMVIHEGKIAGLQRGKDQAKEVKKGFECGLTLDKFNDFKEGDVFECFEMVEVKR